MAYDEYGDWIDDEEEPQAEPEPDEFGNPSLDLDPSALPAPAPIATGGPALDGGPVLEPSTGPNIAPTNTNSVVQSAEDLAAGGGAGDWSNATTGLQASQQLSDEMTASQQATPQNWTDGQWTGPGLNYSTGPGAAPQGSIVSPQNMTPEQWAAAQATLPSGYAATDATNTLSPVMQGTMPSGQPGETDLPTNLVDLPSVINDVDGQPAKGSDLAAGGAPLGLPQVPDSPNAPVSGAVRDALLKLLTESQQAPSLEGDTNLSAQAAAYRLAKNRQAGRDRASLAERAAFTGTNYGGAGSGSFESGLTNIGERAGEDIAQYEAGLIGKENQARRQQLMNALNIANAVGARGEATQLQQQLALLNAQMQREGMGLQRELEGGRLGFDYAALEAEMNRQALMSALGGDGG